MGCMGQLVWALVGAAAFITVVTVTAVLLSKSEGPKSPYTLEDYFNDTIAWRSYNVYWISDTEYLHKTRDGNVYRYNAQTEEESLFLSNSTFGQVSATDYLLSGDHTYVALESNFTKQWRHSYTASYTIYDVVNFVFVKNEIAGLPKTVQYLSWAPTGNKMAYVHNCNVFYKSDVKKAAVQVTSNGEKDVILNGVPDWVYEEEVFASNGALWWSSSGQHLAYAEFNVAQVEKVNFSWYGKGQYPVTVAIPYPKVGTQLTKVKLFVVNTNDTSLPAKAILPPANLNANDHILSSVNWVTDQRIAVQWLTRKQNYVLVQIYDLDGSNWRRVQKFEQINTNGWVGRYGPLPLFFAEDNLSFYKVLSDDSGYKHIHHIQNGKATAMTSGKWEVIYITKLTKEAIYFVSNEGLPRTRNVYRLGIGARHASESQCLTCQVDTENCQYNAAYFSTDASFYRMDCYGPGLPRFLLFANTHKNPGAKTLPTILEENEEIGGILSQFRMPKTVYGTITIGQFDLWYEELLPPNFVSSRRYPLLIDVYGGPASQRVDSRFKLSWSTVLASAHGIIVVRFDGRGSGYQGDAIMHSIYRRLGTFEVEDQIAAVRHFVAKRYVDKDRIAIWGWSYGGYVTAMALGAGTGLFKCGIAVAPVVKWQYYDAVYTERYMGTLADNKIGYENSSVLIRAKNFTKGIEFLLIQGTADDNVHLQHAAQLTSALTNEQVNFKSMWYTDKDHALTDVSNHMYTAMSRFLQDCLDVD
ncbi:dipeptidyl peptidase 4 isoform X2 [Vanacampus margaritifer]